MLLLPESVRRVYQTIAAQHVLCRQLPTQAECQGTPASAELYCAWDAMNSRCLADPYASLVLPMTCSSSKARSFMNCGRRGMVNGCRTDPECVLGKQARCFPAWLVSEARAANVTEQAIAEATALSILKGVYLLQCWLDCLVAISLNCSAQQLLLKQRLDSDFVLVCACFLPLRHR